MRFDLLTMGRSSIDLYSNDVGAPFPEIKSFGAYVGGCPTNIAVGGARLGLRTALLTAVGEDPVGDFVLRFLSDEGVSTEFIPRKADRRTSAVVLGIEPPDRFPLVFYRDNCADAALTIDDANAAPLDDTRMLVVSGTGLSQEPARSATVFAMERARAAGAEIVLDVDFRADQWHDARAFGVTLRQVLGLVDIAIGTAEEFKALAMGAESTVSISHGQISDPTVHGDLDAALSLVLSSGPSAAALKRGEKGAAIHLKSGEVLEAPPFPVDVLNILGAGDAFAAGFLSARLGGLDWREAARMGNATGAIVVTRQGCANFMPTRAETDAFIAEHGGL